MNPEEKWQRLAKQLREEIPDPVPESAPPGFATRIVASQPIQREGILLTRLRNWSLGTAGIAAVAFVLVFSAKDTNEQFLPIPELKFPSPEKS